MTKTLLQSCAIAPLTFVVAISCTAAYAQTKPAAKKPAAVAQTKPAAKKQAAKPEPTEQAVLLGQFGDWGAYKATPGGKKVCFALSKPTSAKIEPSNKKRDPSYAFVSTRPAEKVRNEVSVIVGYPQKPGVDASATVGAASFPGLRMIPSGKTKSTDANVELHNGRS